MNLILELLINAGVLLLIAYLLPTVNIKNYGTAIGVALVIGLLNATIGYLLRLPLNIVTLGLLSFCAFNRHCYNYKNSGQVFFRI